LAADPRRFPGFLTVHSLLIVVTLGLACATVAARSGDPPAGAVARGRAAASTTEPRPTLGPLAGPPSPPVSLDARLAGMGFALPEHANVYAVRVVEGAQGRVYQQFQAGGGALATDFWPASSIKVLAALGALDFARSLGYTGAATVTFDGDDADGTRTLRSIYEPAIRDSSNYDYDLLVRIAGRDRLNSQFLTAAHGFPATSITRSYAHTEIDDSPAMIIEEGDKRTYVPERKAALDPECKAGNCSNLFEMAESVRRIVLAEQLPPEQRFDLDPADLADLRRSLLEAEGFFAPAVTAVLGPGARVYSKPGDAADLDCLDVAFIQAADGRKFLLAATVPHAAGGCDTLVELATDVLKLLTVT
jgi:hypothetical protein